MDFRYKDGSGKVVTLCDVTSLIHAIRDGLIMPDTPFAVGDDKYWHKAETVTAYREAAAVLRRLRREMAVSHFSESSLAIRASRACELSRAMSLLVQTTTT